jgi:predicted hotdog family 3-hydroxylacyl-ACP dehydratase
MTLAPKFLDQRVPSSSLLQWIPHRPPMVWVDEVVSYGPEGGECYVHLKTDALYFSSGHLRSSSLLEFIAQAQAMIGVCWAQINPAPTSASNGLAEAFLVSITKTEFENTAVLESLGEGDTVIVRLGAYRKMGPLILFSGSVWTTDNQCLVRSQMKAFTNFKS